MGDDVQTRLREALKLVAVALKEGDAPFALAGGYALWARGGPEPNHDVDFVVAEEDAARVADLLATRSRATGSRTSTSSRSSRCGCRCSRPPG
jgi:hypothetical protein